MRSMTKPGACPHIANSGKPPPSGHLSLPTESFTLLSLPEAGTTAESEGFQQERPARLLYCLGRGAIENLTSEVLENESKWLM
jgi:hypothetical protein